MPVNSIFVWSKESILSFRFYIKSTREIIFVENYNNLHIIEIQKEIKVFKISIYSTLGVSLLLTKTTTNVMYLRLLQKLKGLAKMLEFGSFRNSEVRNYLNK
jgi:hypothetical protein